MRQERALRLKRLAPAGEDREAQPDYGPPLCVPRLDRRCSWRKDLGLGRRPSAIALTPWKKMSTTAVSSFNLRRSPGSVGDDKELALRNWKTGRVAPTASVMLSTAP